MVSDNAAFTCTRPFLLMQSGKGPFGLPCGVLQPTALTSFSPQVLGAQTLTVLFDVNVCCFELTF